MAVRCRGVTANNTQCLRKTLNESGLCWQHQKTIINRCQALTRKNEQCLRKKNDGSQYCWQHAVFENLNTRCLCIGKYGDMCRNTRTISSVKCSFHMIV